MGGRDGVIDALLMADLNPKQTHFLRILMDPRRTRDSIATICADAGVSPRELLDLFRSAAVAKAHAISLAHMADKALDVTRDIVAKAQDAMVECPACRGDLKDPVEKTTCKRCAGKGTVLREADLDRQKMVTEALGISKKGGGVNISMTQQTALTTPSVFSKFVRASDAVAYDVSKADILDAQVDDPSGDPA